MYIEGHYSSQDSTHRAVQLIQKEDADKGHIIVGAEGLELLF